MLWLRDSKFIVIDGLETSVSWEGIGVRNVIPWATQLVDGLDHPGRVSGHDRPSGYVVHNHRTRGNERHGANHNARQESAVGTNFRPGSDGRALDALADFRTEGMQHIGENHVGANPRTLFQNGKFRYERAGVNPHAIREGNVMFDD